MPTYKAPVDDVQFLLNDVFHMERYGNMPGFADASPDVVAYPVIEVSLCRAQKHRGRKQCARKHCARKSCGFLLRRCSSS